LWRHPSTVLITGATGGIGAALARGYAEPGRTLILHGRDASRLASLTQECEARGALVHGVTFDLRDAAAAPCKRSRTDVADRRPLNGHAYPG
jgi:NADP-dependent 3-hydroxy acid dehydrogenase YdfG